MSGLEQAKRAILDSIDLVEIIGEHVRLRRAGRRWVGLCPFHSEKTPSFSVSPDLGIFKCFGCGKGGDLFSFVQFRENVDFREAFRILADRAGVTLTPRSGTRESSSDRARLLKLCDWAARRFQAQLKDPGIGEGALQYIQERGFAAETIDRFGLGLATADGNALRQQASRAGFSDDELLAVDLFRRRDDGSVYPTFRDRLMFPIRDALGNVIAFGGRTLVDDRAKYLNTRQNALFDKGRGLYSVDLAKDAARTAGRIIVVEGYTDCMAAHQAGYAETVASLGTALTQPQLTLLRRYAETVVLFFDADNAGQDAADRALSAGLAAGVSIRLARVPSGKDPCDLLASQGSADFDAALNSAVDALEFKWERTKGGFEHGNAPSDRREAVHDFLRTVADACRAGSVDPIQRGMLANQVAKLVTLPVDQVHDMLGRLQRGGAPRRRTPTEDEPEAQQTSPGESQSESGLQQAWRRWLEAALNEPALIATSAGSLDISTITDPTNRRIASILLTLAEALDDFDMKDILAQCSDEAIVKRIADFAQRGELRGNCEATIRAMTQQIEHAASVTAIERTKTRLTSAGAQQPIDQEEADALRALSGALREQRHFRPLRKRQQIPADGTAEEQ